MVFFLTKFAATVFREVPVHRAVLLDPNVNCSTTTISSKIAQVTADQPLVQFVKLLQSAESTDEFRYLCEYLYKITSKDFAQIHRHARDVVQMWADDSIDGFLNYLGQLAKTVAGVHIVFSFNYEGLFNSVAHTAATRGLGADSLECTRSDHFELISHGFLKDLLEGVL